MKSTANEVDGKLRMGKGIEEEEEFLPAASLKLKRGVKRVVVASSREWRGCHVRVKDCVFE